MLEGDPGGRHPRDGAVVAADASSSAHAAGDDVGLRGVEDAGALGLVGDPQPVAHPLLVEPHQVPPFVPRDRLGVQGVQLAWVARPRRWEPVQGPRCLLGGGCWRPAATLSLPLGGEGEGCER
jgi:hypothetical protein